MKQYAFFSCNLETVFRDATSAVYVKLMFNTNNFHIMCVSDHCHDSKGSRHSTDGAGGSARHY